MRHLLPLLLIIALFCSPSRLPAQEEHSHAAPEKLGEVSFSISCEQQAQQPFNRAVALLHSFAYAAAQDAFQRVAEQHPKCAMAHWGMAMTYFHQLWEPPLSPATIPLAQQEIQQAQQIETSAARERQFIDAASQIFRDATTVPYRTRVANYERAMSDLAAAEPSDAEAQVFFALALLANASPADKSHANQKQAADLLEPLYRTHPRHPGIPHYLIHAYDNAELAPKGLPAARVYAQIASSTPHALHMPSHIFTRLGQWEDSIASNLAARDAAHRQGNTREEFHAMDYLVYAYLQTGRDADAARIVQQLGDVPKQPISDFTMGYAFVAMPVRYAIERHQWADAAKIVPLTTVPPQVEAIAVWARGLALARSGHALGARAEIERLKQIQSQLRALGNDYWAVQVGILMREVLAWSAEAEGKPEEAASLLRQAADQEDAIEKLPVTPGPIVPAREQLGDLLLEQKNPAQAAKEFATALANAPGRRGALQGSARAASFSTQK